MNDAIDVAHQSAAAETAEKLCFPDAKFSVIYLKNRDLITNIAIKELIEINSMILPEVTKSREAATIADIVKQTGSKVRESGCSNPEIARLLISYQTLATVDLSKLSSQR